MKRPTKKRSTKKSRGRGRLGSPVAEHAELAEFFHGSGERFLARGKKELSGGDCRKAFRSLTLARGLAISGELESGHAKDPAGQKRGATTFKAVEASLGKLVKSCVLAKAPKGRR